MRKSILLFVLFTLTSIPLLLFAQGGYQVTGHIISAEDNQPMIGVSVLEKGHAIMWEHLDTESMVQSIREHLPDFYKDEERLTRMKEHAASFSYEKHIQAYLDLYRELAQLS